MTKKCSLCDIIKNNLEFTENKFDFIAICNSCNQNMKLNKHFSTEDNKFDEYWDFRIQSNDYRDNIINIILNCIDFFFKKIQIINIINYLLLITNDSVMQNLTNNLSTQIVKYSLESSINSLSYSEPLSEMITSETYESWKNFFKSITSVIKNTDSNTLKEILDQGAVKEILTTVIITAINYIINNNLGYMAGKITSLPLKHLVNLFLGDATQLIVEFIKDEDNNLILKDFMGNLFESLFNKSSSQSSSINSSADTEELYSSLSLAIVNTSQDKKLHSNTINKLRCLLKSLKDDKNYHVSLDTYLYTNYADYDFKNIRDKIKTYLESKLQSEVMNYSFIKDFIQNEIKSYLEFKTNN